MQKEYINGLLIKKFEFPNGGTKLSVSMSHDAIKALQDAFVKHGKDGWLRLDITEMRQPMMSKRDATKVVATHSMSVDLWEPKEKYQQQAGGGSVKHSAPPEPEDDIIPFKKPDAIPAQQHENNYDFTP